MPDRYIDNQGDVWTMGEDGMLHTPETRSFNIEFVTKKWGPLRPLRPVDAPIPDIISPEMRRFEQLDHRGEVFVANFLASRIAYHGNAGLFDLRESIFKAAQHGYTRDTEDAV